MRDIQVCIFMVEEAQGLRDNHFFFFLSYVKSALISEKLNIYAVFKILRKK